MDNEPVLRWDGSHIGTIEPQWIIGKGRHLNHDIWKLNINGSKHIVFVRSLYNTTACLADELKPIFGLPKIGTHRATYMKKQVLILRSRHDGSNIDDDTTEIVAEESLDMVDPSYVFPDSFVFQMQVFIIFLDIIGIGHLMEKSFIICVDGTRIYPLSFYEPNFTPHKRNVISSRIYDRWFDQESCGEIIRRLLVVSRVDDITPVINDIRSRIEKVVERVDRDLIWMVAHIVERLTNYLLSGLGDNSSLM